jgi:DNA polymerase-3 subunit alpha
MLAGLEKAMQMGMTMQSDAAAGQMNFFAQTDSVDYAKDSEKLPPVAPWPEQQMLIYEKEVLGFYVTSNPLSHCAEKINAYSTFNSSQLNDVAQESEIVIGGMVTRIRYLVTKRGRNAGAKMADFFLEDLQGEAEIVLFPRVLEKFSHLLTEDSVIFVKGKVDRQRENPNIFAEELIALDEVTDKLATKVRIRLDANDVSKAKVTEIRTICEHHRGRSPVYVSLNTDQGRIYASVDKNLRVNPDIEFCKKMKRLVGADNFQLG